MGKTLKVWAWIALLCAYAASGILYLRRYRGRSVHEDGDDLFI